jgi:hypothetical protein
VTSIAGIPPQLSFKPFFLPRSGFGIVGKTSSKKLAQLLASIEKQGIIAPTIQLKYFNLFPNISILYNLTEAVSATLFFLSTTLIT